MGVPGLFANLHHKYKQQLIKKQITSNLNTILYFDFNCLIHPICHLLWNEAKDTNISNSDFENKLIVKTIEYLEKVIEYVNPSKCGIYIDGVCPISKMVQQRQRRFASVLDKEIMNNIRSKHNVPKETYYDTNSITPGTQFMYKLDQYIKSYIQNKKIEFIYSSYMEHGEGEHKIINHIRNNKDYFKESNIIIYGLDADLIILSLTLIKDFKICLLRESEHVSFDNFNLIYFDVNECGKCLTNEIIEVPFYDSNIIDDFIFITILLGNDFIPPNPTLNMRFRNKNTLGYDILLDTYKKLLQDFKSEQYNYIVGWNDKKLLINWNMFSELINRLATFEQQYFEHAKVFFNNKQNAKNKAEEQIYHLENMMFSHPDPLMMHNRFEDYNWRKLKYIHHYFGKNVVNVTTNSNNRKIESQLLGSVIKFDKNFYNDKVITINETEYNKVIIKYLKTFIYIMYYYYNGCPDNLYYYDELSGILLSDLHDFLDKNMKNKNDDIMIDTFYHRLTPFYHNLNKHTHIHPLEQLLMVLPLQSSYLLPKNIEKLINSNNDQFIKNYKKLYFPSVIKRDFLNKTKLFQATLLLDIPHLDIIRGLIYDKQITKEEADRCLIKY